MATNGKGLWPLRSQYFGWSDNQCYHGYWTRVSCHQRDPDSRTKPCRPSTRNWRVVFTSATGALDLRVNQHEQLPRTKLIPTECQTPVIDCTTPTGVWYKPMSIDVGDKCMCLDPRLFFAGAPSHYLQHPLAKSLNEKIAMSRQSTNLDTRES